jgi:hypothetical protein
MKRIISLAAATLMIAVAACGTDGHAEFTKDFNEAQKPLQQLLTDVGAANDPGEIAKLADGLDKTAITLKAIEAPADIRPQFDAYVNAVAASGDVVRELTGTKPEKLAEALTGLQQQMADVAKAEQALKTAVEN